MSGRVQGREFPDLRHAPRRHVAGVGSRGDVDLRGDERLHRGRVPTLGGLDDTEVLLGGRQFASGDQRQDGADEEGCSYHSPAQFCASHLLSVVEHGFSRASQA